MLRSFSTLCCLDAGLDEVIALAKNNGMQGVELRTDQNNETLGGMGISDACVIREAFDKAELKVTDMALSTGIVSYDGGKIQGAMRGIDFAQKLSAKGVRIFSGHSPLRFSEDSHEDVEGIAKAFRELCDYAKNKNVEVWLETHSSLSTGKAVAPLIELIDRDNMKVIWDIIHSVEYRESPENTVKLLEKKIAHIHVKDGKPNSDNDIIQYIHTDLGKGSVPVKEALSLLDNIGFDGFVSLEWESPWRPEIRDLYPDTNDLLKAYNAFIG